MWFKCTMVDKSIASECKHVMDDTNSQENDGCNNMLFIAITFVWYSIHLRSPQVNPDLSALQVWIQADLRAAHKVGDIESLDGDAQLLGQQLQGHLTGQLLR